MALEQFETLLTDVEVASLLNVSKITIQRQCRAGKLPHIRVGKAIRFSPSRLREWVVAQETCAGAGAGAG